MANQSGFSDITSIQHETNNNLLSKLAIMRFAIKCLYQKFQISFVYMFRNQENASIFILKQNVFASGKL